MAARTPRRVARASCPNDSPTNTNTTMHTNRSHCDAILKHLQKGQTITWLQALDLFDCSRLGARIFDLKAEGHNITRSMVRTPTNKRVASYQLIP